MATEERDIPSKIVPHHDNADQVGVIISSPCTLLNQVPAVSIDSFDHPVHNDHDMSNALNSSCQFDQFSRQISTFDQDYHHDPVAFENTWPHNYGFNSTRPDDHVYAAQVPDLAMDYDPKPAFDRCAIDQGLHELSGDLTFNADSLDYVSIPFGNDDVLNLNNDRPSELIDHEAVQPLFMSNTSDDQNTEGLGNASENTVPEHYEFPELPDDLSFINEFEEIDMFTIPADMQLV